ncbi:anti-repressor Ant [Vibrio phage douglas 12A4]|uniref:anti-repressor Ant n=1 Tax=Vibrio phage douglas 12A4 TaxID=573171 RepID=UPI0002C0A7E6|nr:anti-repressor Ant [Vibrio phage douglas 12A4]AGG58086.1 hypothetical protein VPAG_00050 [Vibrio phage douglas 12A4]
MINLPIQKVNNVDVMSSVDLAELCIGKSKDAHSDFMKKAKKVLGDKVGNFSELISYARGTRTILMLPEREACLMAMSYSYELQAKVYDAWHEKVSTPKLPSTYLEALQQLVEKETLLLEQAEKIALDEPKVNFHDTVTQTNETYTCQLAGKSIQQRPNMFIKWLKENHYLQSSGLPYQRFIDQGLFKLHSGEKNGFPFKQTRVTNKGIAYFSNKLKDINL